MLAVLLRLMMQADRVRMGVRVRVWMRRMNRRVEDPWWRAASGQWLQGGTSRRRRRRRRWCRDRRRRHHR